MEAGAGTGLAVLDAGSINDIPVRTGYLETALRIRRSDPEPAAGARSRVRRPTGASRLSCSLSRSPTSPNSKRLPLRSSNASPQRTPTIARWSTRYEEQEAARVGPKSWHDSERQRKQHGAWPPRTRPAGSLLRPSPSSTMAAGRRPPQLPLRLRRRHPREQPPPAPARNRGRVCPVNGAVSFTDTWGAPRSGGRSPSGCRHDRREGHAARCDRVRADLADVQQLARWNHDVARRQQRRQLLLRPPGRLRIRPVVGSVGVGRPARRATSATPGNARYTVSHLHFEYHPGGGSAVNPYPLTASALLLS